MSELTKQILETGLEVEGWLYMASVLDLGSLRLLGYAMADQMRSELVADAPGMTVAGLKGSDHLFAGTIRRSQPRTAQHRMK